MRFNALLSFRLRGWEIDATVKLGERHRDPELGRREERAGVVQLADSIRAVAAVRSWLSRT